MLEALQSHDSFLQGHVKLVGVMIVVFIEAGVFG